ncbi:MAG: hypothetical protein ACK5PP_00310, partial [Acidimicrobiales bacterium]
TGDEPDPEPIEVVEPVLEPVGGVDRPAEARPDTPAMRRLNALRHRTARGAELDTGPDVGDTADPVVAPRPDPEHAAAAVADVDGGRIEEPEFVGATAPAVGPPWVVDLDTSSPESVRGSDLHPARHGSGTADNRSSTMVDQREAGDAVVEHRRGEVLQPGRADTDANGNWIPPILRGLSADADEAKTSLPHRRRAND